MTRLLHPLNGIYSFFVTIILSVFDSLAMSVTKKKIKPDRIGIIRLDSIGDFILWLDAAKEFRNLYPNKKITLIANQDWAELAGSMPYWDEVITVNRKYLTRNPIYRFRTLRKMRRLGFEVVINPVFSREYLRGDCLVRASGATHKIGFAGDVSNITSWHKNISDRWYTKLLPSTPEPLMELQRNAEFMKDLGLVNFRAHLPSIPRKLRLNRKFIIDNSYCVIVPGASRSGKQWPIENIMELIIKLNKTKSWRFVLCGNQKETPQCDHIANTLGEGVINLAGKTSLLELVEIIRGAEIVVSNDTSAIHIAAAVCSPSVCILGGGHFGRFMPYQVELEENQVVPVPVIKKMECYGCNWQCTKPHKKGTAVPCISNISVNQVLEAIEGVLHKTTSSE